MVLPEGIGESSSSSTDVSLLAAYDIGSGKDPAVTRFNTRARLALVADDARMVVKPAADLTIDRIGAATHDAVATMASTVGPVLGDARERLVPVVEEARERLAPMVEDARERIAPLAATAVAATKDRSQKAAVRWGLVEEPEEPEQTHRLRNLLIVLGLGGIAAFVYTRLSGRDADPAWTASRDTAAASTTSTESTPLSTGSATDSANRVTFAAAAAENETAGASGTGATDSGAATDQSDTAPTAPLASEETVESHAPTTPDEPLERRDF